MIRNLLIDILIEILKVRTLIALGIFLVLYAAYVAYPLIHARNLGKELNKAVPYRMYDASRTRTILVLGDSTAVGVGATPEESVAGRLAQYFNASVENYAKSGAVSADITEQASLAQRDFYDLIVIQVGANDVIHFRNLTDATADLSTTLEYLREKSGHILVLTAGDIGRAPIFRWPISRVMTSRTQKLRELFMKATAEHGAVYVDIYAKPDPMSAEPARYYSADGLHLSGEGYRYWYELVLETMQIWPELAVGRVL